jgi:hypothetical protein
VPLTVKLSAEDAVRAFIAQLEVPYKDPVIDPSTFTLPVTASDPVIDTDPVII